MNVCKLSSQVYAFPFPPQSLQQQMSYVPSFIVYKISDSSCTQELQSCFQHSTQRIRDTTLYSDREPLNTLNRLLEIFYKQGGINLLIYNVLLTKEMHNSYNQFFIPQVFCMLYMFRANLVVHHQQHGIIYCITQFGTIGTIVQASLAAQQLDSPARQ